MFELTVFSEMLGTCAEVLEVGSLAAEGQARTSAIRREVWPWFAWAALAVLLVEWLVYTRRMNL